MDALLVANPLIRRWALVLVLLTLEPAVAWAQPTEFKLTASNATAEDRFGLSVSLWEDRALVGARDAGAAYMFESAFITSAEEPAGPPRTVTLAGPYPNPFTSQTTIRYGLPAPGVVYLTVSDALGREVAVLLGGVPQAAGWHEVVFEGGDLPSGVYLYRLATASHRRTGQMLLLR